ncbi:MAG TPA: cation:proton antiporter [Nitrososphaeraceae archaeon]|nr:cation:proton antiporter [Nitrososphaeraceae archaeon]
MNFFHLITQLEAGFLIQDFAVVMIVAAIMVFVTHKLKQPMVIGYILAGMLIGPFTPPFSLVHNVGTINTLAELGIIILLFVIGTEFPITKLKSVGRISMIVGIAESLGTLLVTFFVARTLGFSQFDSMFLALAMSVTSTVVTVKLLEELNMINEKSSVLIMGILIVEDVIVITMLGILQSLALTAAVSFVDVLLSVTIVLGFIAAILILGSRYLPPLIDKLARTTDYSVLIIVILGLAFGLSFVAIELGLSPVIGAFLAGVLVAESNSAGIARVITIPLRDVFTALFFVSVGALVDVSKIPLFIIPALILIVTSFMAKMIIIIPVLIRAGYDTTTAVRTGLGLASARGEMSLIVGKGGQDVGAVSSYVLPILGVVTIVTTFVTPYILKIGTKLNISSSPSEDKKS